MATHVDFFSLYSANRHSEIIRLYHQNFAGPDQDPLISKIVAASMFTLGNIQESFDILSSIESCFSTDSEYLSLFGACCRRLGELDRARELLKAALSFNPTSLSVKNNYANLLIDLNQFDSAESIIQDILHQKSDFVDAKVNYQRLLEQRKIRQIEASSSNDNPEFCLSDPLALAFSDNESKLSLNLAPSAPQKQSISDKSQKLADALPDPKDYQISSDQINLAFKACQEKRFEFALQLCSEARPSLHTSPSLWECAADAYIGLKQFTQAEVCLLHALSLGSLGIKVYINLSSIACVKSDFLLAQIYYEKAIACDSSSSFLPTLKKQIDRGLSKNNSSSFQFTKVWPNVEIL